MVKGWVHCWVKFWIIWPLILGCLSLLGWMLDEMLGETLDRLTGASYLEYWNMRRAACTTLKIVVVIAVKAIITFSKWNTVIQLTILSDISFHDSVIPCKKRFRKYSFPLLTVKAEGAHHLSFQYSEKNHIFIEFSFVFVIKSLNGLIHCGFQGKELVLQSIMLRLTEVMLE